MRNLDATNYLSLLIEFCFSILFLIIFVSLHYALSTKTKLGKHLANSKIKSFWYFFAFGFILSLLTVITSQAIMLSLNSLIELPITILCLITATAFFYNRSVQVGSIIPSIIWVLFYSGGFTHFDWSWMNRVFIILIVAIVSIASTFLKTKKWPTYIISVFIAILLCLVMVLVFAKTNQTFYIVELAASFVFAILFYAIINWFNRMLNTMSSMAKSNIYSDGKFIIPSSINEQFSNLIKQHNLSQALIVTFKINNKISEQLKKISNVFENKQAMLFKSEYNTYGAIIFDPKYMIFNLSNSLMGNDLVEREDNDPLKNLEKDLNKLNIVAFASIYGVQSNNINELLKFNQFAMTQYDRTSNLNSIQLFDSNMFNNKTKDEINYAQLIQKVDLNDIDVQLEIIETNDGKRYTCPRFYWVKMFTCDVNEIMKKFDLTTSNALLRSLAIKSLEKYSFSEYKGKYPLLIFYPINELTDKYFSPSQFIKKINTFNIDKKDVVLSFNCKKIRLWPRVMLNNLLELQKCNVSFMLEDLINTFCLTLLKPVMVILDSSIEKNKKKLEKALEVGKTFNQNILLTNKI